MRRCFPTPFVIAGLELAIHAAAGRGEQSIVPQFRRRITPVEAEPGRAVDARVKPGHDELICGIVGVWAAG
jgi:hypothetical protein